jgi:hypothetical protein
MRDRAAQAFYFFVVCRQCLPPAPGAGARAGPLAPPPPVIEGRAFFSGFSVFRRLRLRDFDYGLLPANMDPINSLSPQGARPRPRAPGSWNSEPADSEQVASGYVLREQGSRQAAAAVTGSAVVPHSAECRYHISHFARLFAYRLSATGVHNWPWIHRASLGYLIHFRYSDGNRVHKP